MATSKPYPGKRCFDLAASLIGLLVASPLLLIVSCAVACAMGWPLLFRQQRPGLGGKPFELLKFRTMIRAGNPEGEPLPDDRRLTWLGRFLRSTSLDELPELINVLRGDMSLVGPRPLLMQYLPLYSPEQARRHDVKPGITGWAQVNGRNTISWEKKFQLDVWYVDHRSFRLDMKILWSTLWQVFSREGISAEGEATMPEFTGSAGVKDNTGNE